MKIRIKKTYICGQVDNWELQTKIIRNYKPQVGDVGIFEITHIGKHFNVQNDSKRNATIIEGDRIMAAFGTRYATEQFEGYVPEHVNQELHILGGGGTIGVIKSMHYKYKDIGPTKLRMIGLVTDKEGNIINTKKLMQEELIPFTGGAASMTNVILSLGSSMDSGKTTTAAYLINCLKKTGHKVAYIKLTGTVYTKDCDLAYDMGADMVADFGDYGFPSTYMCNEEELLSLYETLLAKVLPLRPDHVIIEIADGLFERETKMLLRNETFCSTVGGVVFSAGDSLSAISGIQILNKWGICPTMISGLFTASPLMIKEVRENTSLPVFTIDDLAYGKEPARLFLRESAMATT